MTDKVTEIAQLDLPYSRKASIRLVEFDSGMKLVRLVLREGTRITQVDLDAESALRLSRTLAETADRL
ncbi:DUF6967 family protein [Ruegeria marina]|uniref:Uncharacterized protein n=1 Tax=Ruegeria marina TaxID=639004 RepID=A0A1G6S4I8_9RHOB|nr:hypothetical protein [Ruegeria marina]SDD11768.1 hypothetical protein SAMN04488239_105173 [Ruegeria marina]